MANSNHGIVKDKRAEEQPSDKQRAQSVHTTDASNRDTQTKGTKGSPSREATRDPKLNDNSKTPGSGMTPDDSGAAPTG
ncbi:hypothetical protein [Bradyrhizobium amphicarpaeae]|uniref:Uncharacterized protein n=1 Tax=Bradyrhizobium amphicarpaeae TaxID=1404768 RepID=A0A2U8PQ91_9BRAD|nr:hypothetical protein [Bradyrhizobium amphicarpaeae]AWL99903.1 hypothetical protein CIT40_07560 [Bradyrhizobium amphicarpaeae]